MSNEAICLRLLLTGHYYGSAGVSLESFLSQFPNKRSHWNEIKDEIGFSTRRKNQIEKFFDQQEKNLRSSASSADQQKNP